MLHTDARHRRQIAHGDLRGDLAFAHQLLHRLGQGLHQGQAVRHPVPAAVETASKFFDRTTQTALHLLKQPALFERRIRLAHAQRSFQHQRVGFAHLPDHGFHRVAAQLLERGNAFVTVDDQKAIAVFDDDDGRLLAAFSQRGNQSPLSRRMLDPEVFQAAVQLMKFQLRHRLRLGLQYAPAPIWSFQVVGEVFREAFVNQEDKPGTGLSPCGGLVCPEPQ